MSRRLAVLLLVPALVGTMVGVGLASLRPRNAAPAVAREETAPAAAPAATEARPERVAAERTTNDRPRRRSSDERREPERGRNEQRKAAKPAAKVKAPKVAAKPAPAAVASVDVAKVQRALTRLKYYVGPIDGAAGSTTTSAVMAFQKVNGLTADGAVGPATLAALRDPVTPTLRGGASNRVEVDLTKQVLYLVQGDALARIVPVSSGNGETYEEPGGGTARALTPVGTYTIERRISGLREAALGSLYDPMYFYQGWAIHGSNSVPAYPASHGCVRVTRTDALWLFDRMPVGTQVSLYGGTHTFSAGSDAAGTSAPAGDTAADTAQPEREPDPEPSEQPRRTPTEEPTRDARPTRDAEPERDEERDTEPTRDRDPDRDGEPKPTRTPKPEPTRDPEPEPEPEPEGSEEPEPKPTASPTPKRLLPDDDDDEPEPEPTED